MKDLLSNLNPDQKKAVLHTTGPAVVLAGAGSGKTTVLTTRVARLILDLKVNPQNILVVTFTNKASQEIKERTQNLTGHSLTWSGTFHSLCAKILRIDGQFIGLDKNFIIYDSTDQLSLIKQIYKNLNVDKEEFNLKATKATISNIKNELLTPSRYQEIASDSFQRHVARIYKIYQHELKKAQAVDFDDLLFKTLQLLQTHQETREKYQTKFTHVLIDEYQDTNKAQYQLSKIFAQPQDNIFVVGDFCQSIYAWRGADYKNMLQLQKTFNNITEYRLEQNYRSKQNILDVATQVISQNTTHPILKLWTTKQKGPLITIFEASSARREAQQVINYIKQHSKEIDLNDIAILYRTNAQSREFEEAFIKLSIPYQLIGSTKFYERKEVKDVLAYLKFMVNRDDVVSYERIIKLGKRRFLKFSEWLKTHSNPVSPVKTLEDILNVTSYLDKYKKNTEENNARIENIKELLNVASQFNDSLQFLENIALIQDNQFIDQATTKNNQTVNLMSLHSAKGLEFELVFMVGMEDGLLPHARSLYNDEQMEEERRLCYVGITRAKSHLYFTYARTRYQYGSNNLCTKSRFLTEMPLQLTKLEQDKKQTKNNYYTYQQKKTATKTKPERIFVPDDDLLSGVLSGEFEVDELIDS